jgi:hypothetical protein
VAATAAPALALALALVLVLVLAQPARAAAGTAAGQCAAPMLARFAPVIVQGAHGRADLIARFDYDGNWNGADNWDNFDRGHPLAASLYASAIESRTHWYLTYSVFHPRDWWPITSVPFVNHENDLEGVLVVVEKGATAGGERVLLVETIAHDKILRYSSHPEIPADRLSGRLVFEGERPIVEIEAYKHGIHAFSGASLGAAKGVIYRFKGRAQVPASLSDRDVGYDLVSLEQTLWAHRFEVGRGKAFGDTRAFASGTFGAHLNGDNYGRNKASAPWNWADSRDKGLAHGDWFLDPARAMHVHYPGLKLRFSTEYLGNPFLYAGASPRDVARARLFEVLAPQSD